MKLPISLTEPFGLDVTLEDGADVAGEAHRASAERAA